MLMKKSLSNCNVNELKVLWISSGRAEPLHSLRSMLLSTGPSHTFKMSWATSVSKTIKCRLQRKSRSTVHYLLNTVAWISKQSLPKCSFKMLFSSEEDLGDLQSYPYFLTFTCKSHVVLFYKCLNDRKCYYEV